MTVRRGARYLTSLLVLGALAACGGGGGGGGGSGGGGSGGGAGCDGACAQTALTEDDVRAVIAQAVAQSQALGYASVIAVTDRVGNVLGVFEMPGAPEQVDITTGRGVTTGLEASVAVLPDGTSLCLKPFPKASAAFAAISKAGTGAYLSSQGNAFTTRTASQIVQQHFDPQERGQPGGPLFGVQFSQLACGDLVTVATPGSQVGPHALPLGLSADAGGIPLYKPSPDGNGLVPVGGVGVEAIAITKQVPTEDPLPPGCKAPTKPFGTYTIAGTGVATDEETAEETIAVGAAGAFAAPGDRRANRIFVGGRSLEFADVSSVAPLATVPFAQLPGRLLDVPPFTSDDEIHPGATLGTAASGILLTTFEGLDAEILVDSAGEPRYPPRAATSPDGMTQAEVTSILRNALLIAQRARAQIRLPLGSNARVTISVVGTEGEILGIVRTPDAPVFGTDVSLQKARNAAFLSSAVAAEQLAAAPTPIYVGAQPIADYVEQTRALLNVPEIFTGTVAFADRSVGNLSRPFFPDGIDGNANGPLSKPFNEWSPFSTGLQLDLVFNNLAAKLLLGVEVDGCTKASQTKNGIQIFPGSVPVYRGSKLIGAVGLSGDGIDQDDMIAFLGLNGAAKETGTINNAPIAIRADRLSVKGSFLRYVNCPVQPFLDSDDQDACAGL